MGLFGKKEKKEDMRILSDNPPELPELPKLPEFPPSTGISAPVTAEIDENELPQLPKFPNNPIGDKFTQNTIKKAVAGEKEEMGVFDAEDLPDEHMEMMQKPLTRKSFRKEYEEYEQSISGSNPEKKFSREYDEDMPDTEEVYERMISAIPTIPPMASPKAIEPPRKPVSSTPSTKSIISSEKHSTKTSPIKKAEPVFIRIDKFEESIKVFQDIKSQISEIEKLIKNTKEIKSKEEEELLSWEKEIQAIKNQVEKINQDIFSKVG